MRKPLGRLSRPLGSLSSAVASTLLVLGACSSGGSSAVVPGEAAETARGGAPAGASAALAQTGLGLAVAPEAVGFELELDGQRFEISLARSEPPISAGYRSFRRSSTGALVPMPAPNLGCLYRGVAELAGAPNEKPGFATMNVCASATGHSAGTAASGVIRAAGRYWRLSPDPADQDESDGVDHFAQPLYRNDTPLAGREPARRLTLTQLPASLTPRLEFREGTDAETKYVDLIVVNDAARVAELGGGVEQTTFEFVETMNALLDGSGLSPRVRVTLRGQVQFDQDPYADDLLFDNGEVDNDSLLNAFLAWGVSVDGLPEHDERMLLSGLDFVGGVVGYAGLGVACRRDANGFIVQAGDASGGFPVLSAVHEMGHTLGMNHDQGTTQGCPNQGFIMAAVGCGNCTGAEEAEFSPCSIDEFQEFLEGPAYVGARCVDDVPAGAVPSCGDGAVQEGESCDCGSDDCSDIDPCCNGATCQLAGDAECSDFNDTCCLNCTVIGVDEPVVCRAARSACDIAESCTGTSKDCPSDSFEPAGADCEDDSGNDGSCYFGDCRSRGAQCEQIAAQQQANDPRFATVGAPPENCDPGCDSVVCGNGTNVCITIDGPTLVDGVPCDGGQCVDGQCVSTIDQCPEDPNKTEPGDCGCGRVETDGDDDGTADCADGCPDDPEKRAPGACGCGALDVDSDGDGNADCNDQCPDDANKSAPGDCGCGARDVDTDVDGTADCIDECPTDPARTSAGACGCGVPNTDTDDDGTPDCVDQCPMSAGSTVPPCTSPSVGLSTSNRSSDDGGCSLASPPRSAGGLGDALGGIGWLALAAVPLWRRRRR